MNKKILPKLRFCDFTAFPEWDIVELGKLCTPIADKAGEKRLTLMSVTSGVGLVPQVEKFGREIAGNAYKNYYAIKKYDFAYNKSATKQYPEGYISMLTGYEEAAIPNSIFTCFRITDKECCCEFFNQLFQNNYHGSWLRKYIEVGARAHGSLSIDNKYLWNMPVAIPQKAEQQKIADCLSSLDELIDAENKKLNALQKHKKGLMQKLFPANGKSAPQWRFPEFRHDIDWFKNTVKNLVKPIVAPKKLRSSFYKNKGRFPIIDQSQEYICGWTDDKDAVVFEKLPLLIFGDHTCSLKLVDEPFAQGADGIKILSVANSLEPEFLYQYLLSAPINNTNYKRHFSELKEIVVLFPKRETGEQQKIADCLSQIDNLISAQSHKIEKLNTHKKGLMQGLFPSIEEVYK